MKLNQIAFQLYTCYPIIKTPAELAKTLRRMRAIGYTGVEVCCTPKEMTRAEIKQLLDDVGLVCCSTHESGKEILENPQAVIERQQALGCAQTVYPCPSDDLISTPESLAQFIANLQQSGLALYRAGITLSYHNHHKEFRKVGGKTVLEQIYAGTTADALQGELDTYWVQAGGGNPVEWCQRLEGRLPAIHLKDYKVNDQNTAQLCEIGDGNLDFQKIVAAAEASGTQWFIVEQDACPGDPVDSLAKSFRYLAENLVEN